jgi:protein TonB
MSLLALHHRSEERELRRYGAAAIAIVLAHLAVIAGALLWYERAEPPAGVTMQPILVDLAPAPAAPQIETEDLAPGPAAQEAEAPPVEPPKNEVVEEQLPPTPPQAEPVVAAPPKAEPKPEPEPVKPQPVRKQVKKPIKKRLVDQSTAARAKRIAPRTPSFASGASAAAAAASYRSALASHLQRFKQYPSSARARNEQGTTALNFTVTRNGRVTSSRLARSSGFASLDQETMALIRRAQPLPAFPPEMREASLNFTVPFSFTIR